uniref:Uncharacterized protein n=1 Tax=Panagrolaimus sp. JU765 TaxID=591449 RepID=A0AC34RPJ7_9BILA
MKLLVFVGLCTIFVIISGFEYGKDGVPKTCWYIDYFGHSIYENFGGTEYSHWVKHCPYENRLHINCKSGKINPNATAEMWDHDSFNPDDFVMGFNWTHIEEDGKSAYIDIHIPTAYFDDFGKSVDLYWKFIKPCTNVEFYRRGNVMLSTIDLD